MWRFFTTVIASGALSPAFSAGEEPAPSPAAVKAALVKAVTAFHRSAAVHGGYVYRYSADFTLREAEGSPGPDMIWLQPPGTPAVGLAFLRVYERTKDPGCLQAALQAARALTRTQLMSGGWFYSGDFSASGRNQWHYRRDTEGRLQAGRKAPIGEAGWHAWKSGKFKDSNLTTLDDDVSQSALRFLVEMDRATGFKDAEIHEAAQFGLKMLLTVQYPAGGWSTSHDTLPEAPPAVDRYPLVQASFPETWSRTWTKDFTGCYVTNDNLHATAMEALLLAWDVYREPRYLEGARRAGDFLILAQLPPPQPAWAQQYDEKMQPVWGRAFECPAVSGRESQSLMWALLRLAAVTGDKKYLAPVPPAVVHLRQSLLPSGKLARFYELQTNRPLYFQRGPGGKGHELTYEDDRTSSNYGWLWEPELDQIQDTWKRINQAAPVPRFVESKRPRLPVTADAVGSILKQLSPEGFWVETEGEGAVMRDAKGRKTSPPGGVVHSSTFVQNADTLCDWLDQGRP